MKSNLIVKIPTNKTIFMMILLLLTLSCSASKEYDETPVPIGGDTAVRRAFQFAIGNGVNDLRGQTITFLIKTNENGKTKSVKVKRGVGIYYDEQLETAIKTLIDFTPATKNGRRVEAEFLFSYRF